MRARKAVVCLVVLSAFLSAPGTWATWQDGASNPVFAPAGGAYYPCVLYDGDSFSGHGETYPYKMWFTSRSPWGIGLACSSDGLNWTLLACPVSGLANPHHATVVYDPGGFGGTSACYRIWYWAQSENLYSIAAIHTARSADGVNWTDDQAVSQVGSTVVTGSWPAWNYGSYGPIATFFNAAGSSTLDDTNVFNNRFVMYYDGTTGGQEAWGLAYSTDGLLWKGYNGGVSPVLPVGASGAWDDAYAAAGSVVRRLDGHWDLWYSGGRTASSQGIGHATSTDGIVWTRDPANPLTDLGCPATGSPLGCAGTWDASRNYTPSVLAWPSLCAPQSFKMWRTGKSAASGDASYAIGYAEMTLPAGTVRHVPADYATIQAAIDAAASGDTVLVAPGTYRENLILTKGLTLAGQDRATCILQPAVSAPNPCPGTPGDPLCPGASNMILVRAAGVTVHDLTLDGDNPLLTSGVVRNGADLDARNGILLDQPASPFPCFEVHHCTVRNLYLRGIYAYNKSDASLDLHDNSVDNVQGDNYYSIGLFSRHSHGTVARNAVSRCPDGISANWSHGIDFLENVVSQCGSGVHTDNSGSGAADPPDLLQDNTVSSPLAFGSDPTYGVWAFNPAQGVTLVGNSVSGCDVGLAVQGTAAGATPFLQGNSADGLDRGGSVGALVTTDLLGYGSASVAAVLADNHFVRCGTGVSVVQQAGVTAMAALLHNRIAGNASGLINAGGAVTAEDNWWGCNYGPGTAGAGCPSAPNGVTGVAPPLAWLTLGMTAAPASVPASGGTSAVTASLPGVPDATPVQFSGTLGTCAPASGVLVSGSAASTFTAGATQGAGSASVTVDGQTLSSAIAVDNPVPVLASLSPRWARVDAAVPFTLTLSGSSFLPTSSVRWDGAPLATTYVSATQLTVPIAAAQRTLGTHGVTVFNPAPAGGTSAALPFEVRAVPTTVYVDGAWAATPPDDDPDGAGPATHFGYDAFAVIQDGVDAVATSGTVVVHAGTYLAEVTVSRAMLLQGAGIDLTVLTGRKGTGGSTTLTIGGGATVEGFTITRDGNNPADWGTNVKTQGVLFSPGTTGSTLRACKVTGNRNGVYINAAQGHTVRDCLIDFNRTGFQFANDVTGTTVVHNRITDNWTMGVLFINNATPTTSVTIRDNLISGNWYGEIQCRMTGGTALLDVSRNSSGGAPLVRTDVDSSEPSYAAQIPVEFGGTATPPGNAPTVGGVRASRLDYTPWLHAGSDSDPGPGFQGDYSDLHASAGSAQIEALGPIGEALGLLPGGGGTVRIEPGSYGERLDLASRPALVLLGAGRDVVTLKPATTTSWAIPGYPQYDGRKAALRAYACASLAVSGLTLDLETVRGNNVVGLFAWDTPLAVDACAFRNNSLPDNQAVAEITSYVRAPAFTPAARAPVSFTNSRFTDTGRIGIVLHDWLNATLDHNTFHKEVHDFGYAVELGSAATGSLTYNTVDGYDTPASDGSQSAGFYIENAFTSAITEATPKPVAVGHNEISACQYGLWIGNEYPDYAGDVDIAVTLDHNDIHDNLEGGVFVADEGRDHGSSVTLTASDDIVRDNGTFGYFLTTYYNGEIHADLQRQTLTGQPFGLRAEDYNPNAPDPAPPYNSLYAVSLTLSDLSGDATYGIENATAGGAVFTGTCNWWGSPTGATHATNVGGAGSAASDGVVFSPWAGADTSDCALRYAIPTELTFVQQPTTTPALAAMAPAVTVRAQDASGNLGYNFAGTVGLALSGGTPGAVLAGGSAGATHGLAPFAALSVDLDGTGYTLGASSAGLTGDTSDPFEITAANPAITSITEESTCGLDIRVTFTPGTGAVRHDLLRDGSVAVTGYLSGDLYAPPDAAQHAYVVRAVRTRAPLELDSPPADFTDHNIFPPRVGDTVTAAESDPAHFRFDWTGVPEATEYKVWRSDSAQGPFTTLVGTSPTNALEGLDLSDEPAVVFYQVQAFNGACGGPMD